MARLITQRDFRDGGRVYPRRRVVTITDEGEYHHLLRSGAFRDLDKTLTIIQPARQLGRLPLGSMVTVYREMGLGDVLMVLVVIREMKARYPRLKFRLATGRAYVDLARGLDFLHDVTPLMDLNGRIQNVIELRNFPERHPQREVMDRIDLFALHCGVKIRDYALAIRPVPEVERENARRMIGPGRSIALAVRGSTHVRSWPLASVQEFAGMAARRGWTVIILDHERFEIPEHPNIRNLSGTMTLLETVAVIAESEFCISPDSGLQHVAEAVGTKCLALYSTIPPALRISRYRFVKAIWRKTLHCCPCHDRGCAPAPCTHIAPERVLAALERWDSLAYDTDADSAAIAPLRLNAEREIMESWIECVHCREAF